MIFDPNSTSYDEDSENGSTLEFYIFLICIILFMPLYLTSFKNGQVKSWLDLELIMTIFIPISSQLTTKPLDHLTKSLLLQSFPIKISKKK